MRFTTVLMMRNNTVVVAKPNTQMPGLDRGTFMRLSVPNDGDRQLRLEVVTPHLNMRDGTPVFVCKVPERFVEQQTRRKADRYETSRFTNLRLSLAEHRWQYRVLDVSASGCKVVPRDTKPQREFPPGHRFNKGSLVVGDLRIPLEYVVPRSYQGNAVGVEFTVSPPESNQRQLQTLIDALRRKEVERLREGRETELARRRA